jgi:hypothetical protein
MQQVKVLKIVWLFLVLSQVMYGVVIYIAPNNSLVSSNPLPLWIPAAMWAGVSLALFSIRLTPTALAKRFAELPPRVAMQKTYVLYIICWALNESVSLFGFVTAFAFTHDIKDFIPFMLAGIALDIVMFPRLEAHVQAAMTRESLQGT